MLGVPDDERGPLRDWSLTILGALEPVLTPEQFQRGTQAVDEFKLYLRDLVARRSREQHLDEGEILSKLIAASELSPNAGAGDRMTDLELLHNCIFLLNAGHETTTNLIGNGVDLLIRNPDALRNLRDHPELIESAVEEFLRVESSNKLGNPRAAKDTTLGGVAMQRGTLYPHRDWGGEPRSGSISQSRASGHRPASQSTSRLRHRNPRLRRDVACPDGGSRGDRQAGAAVRNLGAWGRIPPRRPSPLPRLSPLSFALVVVSPCRQRCSTPELQS